MVERRIEAGDLGQAGKLPKEGFNQVNLCRQVVRGQRADLPQLLNHFGGDELRFRVSTASMNDAMPDGCDITEFGTFVKFLDQQGRCCFMIGGMDGLMSNWLPISLGYAKERIGLAYAFDLSSQLELRCITRRVKSKLDAR